MNGNFLIWQWYFNQYVLDLLELIRNNKLNIKYKYLDICHILTVGNLAKSYLPVSYSYTIFEYILLPRYWTTNEVYMFEGYLEIGIQMYNTKMYEYIIIIFINYYRYLLNWSRALRCSLKMPILLILWFKFSSIRYY